MTLWRAVGASWAASLALAAWIFYQIGARRSRPDGTPAIIPPPQVPEASAPSTTIIESSQDSRWVEAQSRLLFQDSCQKRLSKSIVDHLRSTTVPLTEDLLGIQSGIINLVQKVREHDQKMLGGEDLAWVEELAHRVTADMAEVARLTQSSHQGFAHHLDSLRKVLDTILEISHKIEDLSERINVLSINASIEAARAGVAGRGFKVIAGAVKGLALETSTFLGQITTTVQSTQHLFQGIGTDLHAKGTEIGDLLGRQDTSFSSFHQAFVGQRAEFEALYRAILAFTDQLDRQMARISPVVQLHDITVQELENLALVVSDGVAQAVEARTKTPPPSSVEIVAWAEAIRHRLTTADELAALEATLEERGVKTNATKGPVAGALDLF